MIKCSILSNSGSNNVCYARCISGKIVQHYQPYKGNVYSEISTRLTIALSSITLGLWLFTLPIYLIGFLGALTGFGSLLLLSCLLLGQVGWHGCAKLLELKNKTGENTNIDQLLYSNNVLNNVYKARFPVTLTFRNFEII